jgi:hypothetical protein
LRTLWFRVRIGAELVVPGATLLTAALLSGPQGTGDSAASDVLVYANRGWHSVQPDRPTPKAHLDSLNDPWAWR